MTKFLASGGEKGSAVTCGALDQAERRYDTKETGQWWSGWIESTYWPDVCLDRCISLRVSNWQKNDLHRQAGDGL